MTFWSRIRSWLDATLRRSRLESEMDAELRFHLEAYAQDLVSGGVPRQEAMRRARIEFGGIERVKEEGREETLAPDANQHYATGTIGWAARERDVLSYAGHFTRPREGLRSF